MNKKWLNENGKIVDKITGHWYFTVRHQGSLNAISVPNSHIQ